MENITRGRIVNYHNFGQVWFHGADIFDVSAATLCAMLTIITAFEVLSILL